MYSEVYADDRFMFRHVQLPRPMAKEMYARTMQCKRLLAEEEWRALGVCQRPGWVHYDFYLPEPHILLFRRPHTEPCTKPRTSNETGVCEGLADSVSNIEPPPSPHGKGPDSTLNAQEEVTVGMDVPTDRDVPRAHSVIDLEAPPLPSPPLGEEQVEIELFDSVINLEAPATPSSQHGDSPDRAQDAQVEEAAVGSEVPADRGGAAVGSKMWPGSKRLRKISRFSPYTCPVCKEPSRRKVLPCITCQPANRRGWNFGPTASDGARGRGSEWRATGVERMPRWVQNLFPSTMDPTAARVIDVGATSIPFHVYRRGRTENLISFPMEARAAEGNTLSIEVLQRNGFSRWGHMV